jgi:hypothetical protein
MRKLMLAGALVLPLMACENSHTPTVPTSFASSGSVSITAASSVTAQRTTFGFCPTTPPFTARIGVIVTAGDANVFVTNVTSQFTDQNGIQMPPVTLPAPVPTTPFGSALVAARSSVTFPVDVRFGCGTAATGIIFLTVRTTDGNGLGSNHDLRVAVH